MSERNLATLSHQGKKTTNLQHDQIFWTDDFAPSSIDGKLAKCLDVDVLVRPPPAVAAAAPSVVVADKLFFRGGALESAAELLVSLLTWCIMLDCIGGAWPLSLLLDRFSWRPLPVDLAPLATLPFTPDEFVLKNIAHFKAPSRVCIISI